jgi:hypothetical protein
MYIAAMSAGENGKNKTRMNEYLVSWNRIHPVKCLFAALLRRI